MALPRAVPAVLGSLAVLATTTLLALLVVLAQSLLSNPSAPVRVTAIVASGFEGIVLVVLCSILSMYLNTRSKDLYRNQSGVWFGLFSLLCTVSAVISAAVMVCLNNAAGTLPNTIFGSEAIPFLVGASVALGISFAAQLVFLVVHFVLVKMHGVGLRPDSVEEGRRSPQVHVKSIPYSQTSSPVAARVRVSSVGSRTPPGSSGGRSTADSIRSSLSHVVRPITSKTRLLSSNSQRSPRRPASLDSNAFKERNSAGEDAFDTWDTSTVDANNRQMVLQTSGGSLSRHFLETIPASPTTSRSPSPGMPLDLMPPPRRPRRSRSYSPVATRTRVRSQTSMSQQSSPKESHIHPLFRSDSPTPPPIAKPGTVVTAAPNAGQLISDAHSIRSLSRMHSCSLPQNSSPLSTQESFEDTESVKRGTSPRDDRRIVELHLQEKDDVQGEDEEPGRAAGAEQQEERQMTPPIPDWIMTAGSRTSLYGYNSRRQRTDDGNEKPVRRNNDAL